MSIQIKGMVPLLMVFDMLKSLDFYCDMLGFKITQSAGPSNDIGWALLQCNGCELMLNTMYEKKDRPPNPDTSRNLFHKDTVLYFGCPDIDLTYKQLMEEGIMVTKPYITSYGWKAMDVVDPDHYHLCFHWPLEK